MKLHFVVLLFALLCVCFSVSAQEKSVVNPDFESRSFPSTLSLDKVTFGGDTTRLSFTYRGNPRYWFQLDSRCSICTGEVCFSPIGIEVAQFDKHIYPLKQDSALTFSILFPHIDGSTKSISWQEPEGFFFENVQLQQGVSLAESLSMPAALRKKCEANRSSAPLATPQLKTGLATLRGRLFGLTPHVKSNGAFLFVANPISPLVNDRYDVEIADDGSFEVVVPLPISTCMVNLNIPDIPSLSLLASIDEVVSVYVDIFSLSHMDLGKLSGPQELPLFVFCDGANAAVNNVMCSPGYVALLRAFNQGTGYRGLDLVEYKNVLVRHYNSFMGECSKRFGATPAAVELFSLAMRQSIAKDLCMAKHNLVGNHRTRGNGYDVSKEELDKLWNSQIPDDFYDFVSTSNFNDLRTLLGANTPFRNFNMAFSGFFRMPFPDVCRACLNRKPNSSPEQLELLANYVAASDNGESPDNAEQVTQALNAIAKENGFMDDLLKEIKEWEYRKGEEFFAQIVGVTDPHALAIQLYRVALAGDPIGLGHLVPDADFEKLAGQCDEFFVENIRSYNQRLKAKLDARRPLAASSVNDESLGSDILDKLAAKFPGKAFFIEFWSTGCPGCVSLNNRMEDVKQKFKDSDIVFVYLADDNSPLKLWQNAIESISGEHYRLSNSEMKEVRKRCAVETTGYPTVVMFDKKGNFVNLEYHSYDYREVIELLVK